MAVIKKRPIIPEHQKLVRRDPVTGEKDYRVPPCVIKWPQPFRERVVRDWIPITRSMLLSEAHAYRLYMEYQSYDVQGTPVAFRIRPVPVGSGNPDRVNVATYLEHVSSSRKFLLLNHSIPIVRSLQIYSYITQTSIQGLPKMTLHEKIPEW